MKRSPRSSSGSPSRVTSTLTWPSPPTATYIQQIVPIMAEYHPCCVHSLAACLLPHRWPKRRVVVTPPVGSESTSPLRGEVSIIAAHSLLRSPWCFLVGSNRVRALTPNINAVHILHLHNNLFHVSWQTEMLFPCNKWCLCKVYDEVLELFRPSVCNIVAWIALFFKMSRFLVCPLVLPVLA